MRLKNKTKRRFWLEGKLLSPDGTEEFTSCLLENPVVKVLLARGELEVIAEVPPFNPKKKPTDPAELESLLKKIANGRRDGLAKLCGEYGLPVDEGDDAKALKAKLNAFLTGGDENADGKGSSGDPSVD